MKYIKDISSIIKQGGSIYLYKQHSSSPNLDIAYQTIETLIKIERILEKAGGCKSYIHSANIYIRHIEDFHIVSSLWAEWTKGYSEIIPACIHANMINDSNLVELTITSACINKVA